MIKVNDGQDPYSVIGKYIREHMTAIEDMIAVIEIDGYITNELFMVDMDADGYFVWKSDWWEGEKNVSLVDFFPVSDAKKPSAQPEHTNSCYTNSWCIDCKEYDTENKCCPRYNRVIKQTLDEVYAHAETEAEARFHAEIVRCKDCKYYRKDHGWNCIEYTVCAISPIHTVIRKPDDYCSRAGRRTE